MCENSLDIIDDYHLVSVSTAELGRNMTKSPTMPPRFPPNDTSAVKHIFAQRLRQLLLERDWNQSDLARAAGVSRENISTFTTEKHLPKTITLKKIAQALGFKSGIELLPEMESLKDADNPTPTFGIRAIDSQPGMMWVRVNQSVPRAIALKIFALLNDVPAAKR